MMSQFDLAARVFLRRRLKKLIRVSDSIEIDIDYITCAEYQLFIDIQKGKGVNMRPDHWKKDRFEPGSAKQPISGVRASDAHAFCQWLNQQETTPGFQYRLPMIREAASYPGNNGNLGCWCRDGKKFSMAHPSSAILLKSRDLTQKMLCKSNLVRLALEISKTLGCSYSISQKCDVFHLLGLKQNDIKAVNLNEVKNLDQNINDYLGSSNNFIVAEIEFSLDVQSTILDSIVCICYYTNRLKRALNKTVKSAVESSRELAIDIRLSLNSTIQDLTRDIAPEEFTADNIVKDIKKTQQVKIFIEQAIRLAHSRNIDLSIDLAIDLDVARDLDHTLNQARDITIRLSLLLETALQILNLFSRCQIFDFSEAKAYFLFLACTCKDFVVICNQTYDNDVGLLDQFRQEKQEFQAQLAELIERFTSQELKLTRLCVFISLIELRRQGKIPAWEGIRIVRERIND